MLRDWLRGAVRSSLATAALVALAAGPLLAQGFGKIQGQVTNATTGQPISGAQVTVVGTTLGNITNDEGFYFINNVPARLVSVEAAYIGYRPVVIEDQRILTGQTTTLNFQLEQTAVALEPITVEGERNPLVPRDQTVSKAIVTGQAIERLPLDNAASIVVLQPGVISTNQGRTIRGSRPNEEAVYVNGILIRNFGTGDASPGTIPTNALEQVDVITGAFSAEFGQAQSGIVNYSTRIGGPSYTGALEFMTDQLAPDDWRTNLNRMEASIGGPITGPLTFFAAGTFVGAQDAINEGFPTLFVRNGVDTCPTQRRAASAGDLPRNDAIFDFCAAHSLAPGDPAVFNLDRTSGATDASDFIAVGAPSFVPWDNGRTEPGNFSDEYNFLGNLTYQLPRGSRVTLGYSRARVQEYGRSGTSDVPFSDVTLNLYNPFNFGGGINLSNTLSAGTYLVLQQSAESQIALDVSAAYLTSDVQTGLLDTEWYLDHRAGSPLGFSLSNIDFFLPDDVTLAGFDMFDPSDEFINAFRTGGFRNDDPITFFPGREEDLSSAQSFTGLARPLRANPYGAQAGFNITGQGLGGLAVTRQNQLQLNGTVDWQIGRFNRINVGGEFYRLDLTSMNVTLAGNAGTPQAAEPVIAGAFLEDRLDLGDVVLVAGVRWDYLDSGIEFPRVPGYSFAVPDQWKRGFVVPTTGDDGESLEFAPLPEPCNGADPCINNFIEAQTKSEFSPRLSVSFPVTPTSTFRLSYGRFVQTPAFFEGAANGTVGYLDDINTQLFAGGANTNTNFARDVDMPSTRQFEFGYRQLIGEDLVFDISAYNKKSRNLLTFRKIQWCDPQTLPASVLNDPTPSENQLQNAPGCQPQFINTMMNADFYEANGFDLKIDKAVGNIFNGSLAYSFTDARGTGSDPFTYTGLIFRNTSNIAAFTGQPENPPVVLLPLEQSVRHNIGATASLLFPGDFLEDNAAANAILSNLGVFATLRVQSGLPYTPLINAGSGQIGPPSDAGLTGELEGGLSSRRLPWSKAFDVRFTKGIQLSEGMALDLFADWRNPFDISNLDRVFLETGSAVNELHRSNLNSIFLGDQFLDGDSDIDDFDIVAESPDNAFNQYMLLQAEQRFGNGDGVFTVAEQTATANALYDLDFGLWRFMPSNQNLRLGLRLSF